MLKDALFNTLSEVYYCEHRMDNSFVSLHFNETEQKMKAKGYIPEGICLNPDYAPQSGYGLMFIDENGEKGWVHISKRVVHNWLRELGFTPPPDIIWDDAAWKKHVWRL